MALFLFILAIQLMKEGAKALAPTLTNSPLFSNPFSTLGAGWLGAYIVLSGSPVAAVALSLYVGGVSTELQTFTMLSGSRLGASFVVLLVGFLYAVRNRGRNRSESIGMGVLALSLTAVVYIPGMLLGYGILRSGVLDPIRLSASSDVLSLIDVIWGPVLDALTRLPGWSLLAARTGHHPRVVPTPRQRAPAARRRTAKQQSHRVDEAAVADVRARLRRGHPDVVGLRGAHGPRSAREPWVHQT